MLSEKVELEFLKKLKDKNFQAKLSAAKSPEDALKVVKAEGFNVGLQDFKDSMQKLSDYLKSKSGELSDSDLESVAGGRGSRAAADFFQQNIGHIAGITMAAAAAV